MDVEEEQIVREDLRATQVFRAQALQGGTVPDDPEMVEGVE